MDKQIKYLVGVLLLLVIAAYFISIFSGLPQFFKDDIIAFLEERVDGELSFDSVSLWPLNRIRLNEFEFADAQGNVFKVEQLNLDYTLNFNLEELIEINFLEFINAEIVLNEDFFVDKETDSFLENIGEEPENGEDFLENLILPDFLAEINLNILDSRLSYTSQDLKLELFNLQLGLAAKNVEDYRINLNTDIYLERANIDQFNLENINFEELKMDLVYSQNESQLYFETADFQLRNIINNLEKTAYNFQDFNLDLDNLSSNSAFKGEILFSGSEIIDFKSELDLKDLDFYADYNYSEQESQRLEFEIPELKLYIEGPELELTFDRSSIFIDQNRIDLTLALDREYNYELKAEAAEFNLNYTFIQPYLEEGEFDFEFQLKGIKDGIDQAFLEINGSSLKTAFIDFENAYLKANLLDNEIFMEEAVFEAETGSQLKARGSYNLIEENYLLSAEADNFLLDESIINVFNNLELNLDEQQLLLLEELKNNYLDFTFDLAGVYGTENLLSAAGDLNLGLEMAEKENKFNLNTSFWYAENNLFIEKLKLESDFGRLDLMGELDLASEEFNLRYTGHNLDLEIINIFTDLNLEVLTELKPSIDFAEGSIQNDFSNPAVNLRLRIEEFNYQGFAFENITLRSSYQNDNLIINELKTDVDQATLRLGGNISDVSQFENAVLDLEMDSENLYFYDLEDFSGQQLPLSGAIDLRAVLKGSLADYELEFYLNADNSTLTLEADDYELSRLAAVVKRENGRFLLEELIVEQQQLTLNAEGYYSLETGFNIDYQLNNFILEQYLNQYQVTADNLSGSLDLNGNLSGSLNEILVEMEFNGENLNAFGLDFEIVDNFLIYNLAEDRFIIDRFNLRAASGSYNLRGELYNLRSQIESDLTLELVDIPTRNIAGQFSPVYPFGDEMFLNGKIDFKSLGTEYRILVDLSGSFLEAETGSFNLSGKIDQDLDLNFEAQNLDIDFMARQLDINFHILSKLDLSGSIEGSLDSPILSFSHEFRELSINNTHLESIRGDILFDGQRRFSASETVEFVEGGDLKLDGSYSFIEDEINLSSNLNSLPIGFLLSFFGDEIDAEGEINGSFRAEGSLESPVLDGELRVAGEYLELGLSDPIENYSGQISLSGGKAVIDRFKADFVDGDFNLTGDINFFDLEDSWNLKLRGQRLYFDHGSLEGLFDADLEFVGPLNNPLLQGDMLIYDFIVGIPFVWPQAEEAEEDIEENEEDAFIPRIDLDLTPGQNLRVISQNPNMQIPVETGSLNVNFDHRRENALELEGRLRSTQGVFSYYNTRFNINSAEVIFTPVDENAIPTLRANATTYASGREININLSGPADDMRINLSSTPEMTEEEIFNLLTTRGALGSAIIGGEDVGIQTIIIQELVRIVSSFLQEDIISELESDFRTAFSLDRIEVDVYQLGLEREFAIYLGKDITDRLYLEYAAFFSEDDWKGEISFQYGLTEQTVIKGSYFGDDEYQISIETGIEF